MIHLFRKIRRDLIEEKRLNKYLLYAFGEIVLVMVGILLALYFNKIATEKESNKKANWYLVNIAEDINYQKEDLNYLKEDLEISIAQRFH